MRVTRSAGLAVCVGNDFVRFEDLPSGIPEYGDGDYEVAKAEDASKYPEPPFYVKPASPEKAAPPEDAKDEGDDHPKKRKSRIRSG